MLSRSLRRIACTAAIVGAGLLGFAATAGNALAQVGIAQDLCYDRNICFYHHLNLTGYLATYTPRSFIQFYNLPGSLNDRMSSWDNESWVDARWYWDQNGGGPSHCMQPYTAATYVGNYDNDRMTSTRIYLNGTYC